MADECDVFDEDGPLSPSERDWRGMGIALAVILAICSMIVLTILVFTPLDTFFPDSGGGVARPMFLPSSVDSCWWTASDKFVVRVEDGIVREVDIETGSSVVIDDVSQFLTMDPDKERRSIDDQWKATLLPHSPAISHENLQHSVTLEARNGTTLKIGKGRISHLDFSKSRVIPHAFLFVEDGRLFYVEAPGKVALEVSPDDDSSFHGILDWMTHEELLRIPNGMAAWWSQSADFLAFASLPRNAMKTVTLETYGGRYNQYETYYYPKTREKRLPAYTISIWNRKTHELHELDVQLRNSTSFHYLFGVDWLVLHGQEVLLLTWANRWQNHTSLTLCRTSQLVCSLIKELSYEPSQWAEPDHYLLKGHSRSVFFIFPRKVGGEWFDQVMAVDVPESLVCPCPHRHITNDSFDIKKIVHVDEDSDSIYFMAKAPLPRQLNIYERANISGEVEPSRCLLCSLNNCTVQIDVSFSSDSNAATMKCLRPFESQLLAVSFNETTRDIRHTLLIEDKEKEPVHSTSVVFEEYALPNGYEAIVKIVYPIKKSSRMPVIHFVYGGPGDQRADEGRLDDLEYLLLDHVVVSVDGRGSDGRGWKYRSPIYGHLGTVEVEDQIQALKRVLATHHELDPDRVLVIGWSYGGFMVLKIVENSPLNMYRCAISGAPVTNFLYYDAAYTERYMGDAPDDAYHRQDAIRDLSKFNHTRLLLIHGLKDDNVHFQHSALLMTSLQSENVMFDVMTYPNERHAISQFSHLAATISTFIRTCFH